MTSVTSRHESLPFTGSAHEEHHWLQVFALSCLSCADQPGQVRSVTCTSSSSQSLLSSFQMPAPAMLGVQIIGGKDGWMA